MLAIKPKRVKRDMVDLGWAGDAAKAAAARRAANLAEADEALVHYEGARPPRAALAQAPIEPANLAEIDTRERGRAARVAWRPRTLFKQGDLTRRQYLAACDLVDLHQRATIAPMGGGKWGAAAARVDGSSGGARPHAEGMLDASRVYQRALGVMGDVQRFIVESVCVRGQTLRDVAAHARCRVCWLPESDQNREVAVKALFAAGLDAAANTLRIGGA